MIPVHPPTPDADRCLAAEGAPGSAFDLPPLLRRLEERRIQLAVKRALDVILASLALVVLGPLWLVIAGAILMESGRPVLFRQERTGYRGRPFTMYKFRSMKAMDDTAMAARQREAATSGVLVKGGNDPRVTRLGRILRRTSLDELPQLLNVLKGDMSLIGPRPLLAFMLAPHGREAEARALVRPGLTGLWQIRDRPNNLTAAAMMPHDLEYIEHFSLALDLKILLRTPAAVLSTRGAV